MVTEVASEKLIHYCSNRHVLLDILSEQARALYAGSMCGFLQVPQKKNNAWLVFQSMVLNSDGR